MYGCFVCLFVCTPHAFSDPRDIKIRHQILWDWSYINGCGTLWDQTQVLWKSNQCCRPLNHLSSPASKAAILMICYNKLLSFRMMYCSVLAILRIWSGIVSVLRGGRRRWGHYDLAVGSCVRVTGSRRLQCPSWPQRSRTRDPGL